MFKCCRITISLVYNNVRYTIYGNLICWPSKRNKRRGTLFIFFLFSFWVLRKLKIIYVILYCRYTGNKRIFLYVSRGVEHECVTDFHDIIISYSDVLSRVMVNPAHAKKTVQTEWRGGRGARRKKNTPNSIFKSVVYPRLAVDIISFASPVYLLLLDTYTTAARYRTQSTYVFKEKSHFILTCTGVES